MTEFVAIARLRRDTMILDKGTKEDMNDLGKQAVEQGRAAEVFVIALAGYFSESEVNFVQPDQVTYGGGTRHDDPTEAAVALQLNTAEAGENTSADKSGDSTKSPQVPAPTQGAKGHNAGEADPGSAASPAKGGETAQRDAKTDTKPKA